MINWKAKRYLRKRAKWNNLIIPNNYIDVLKQYCEIVKKFGYKLIFNKWAWFKPNTLNSDAGYFKHSSIHATPEWATQLVLYNSEEVHNAFMISIGHELTHKDCDIFFLKYGPRNVRFIAWVNETHADFGASEKMANSNRQKLLDSMKYKKEHKDEDKDDCTHPSWEQRIYYAEHFDFGKELIQQIAMDTGCQKQDIIDKVCEHFQEIKLTPPPKND